MPSQHALFADSRLLLSAGTLVKAGFAERVKAARHAGVDAISLFPQQYLDAIHTEKLSTADMRAILADHDIALDEVDPLLDWYGPGASRSESLMFDIAAALGARSINVAPAFASNRQIPELTEAFSRLCERATQHGLRADLEFLPWTTVPDLASALKLVEDTGQDNAGVMFDCWHFFRSGDEIATINSLTAKQVSRIKSLQVNDAALVSAPLSLRQKMRFAGEMLHSMRDGVRAMGASSFFNLAMKAKYPHPDASAMMNDAMCSRLPPGQGEMPLLGLLRALDSVGCKPTVGIEVFSLEALRRPASEVAETVVAAYRSLTGTAA